MTATAFYCVSDARFFLGAVGLINSLRVIGHHEPIFVLDCGLTDEQRGMIAAEATLVPAPAERPPQLLKTVAPLAHPAEVMVLIDADMIVTRSIGGLIERARGGSVVAVRDRQQRYFDEWGKLPGLGPARPGPYVSSGLVFLAGSLGNEVLRLLDQLHTQVDFESTFWGENVQDYPYLYADQDVLNAILRTRVARDRLEALEHRFAATPPFRSLRCIDAETLSCAFRDGAQPYVVHQFVRKPWLERMYHGVYSQLLARLLLGDDVAIKVPETDVPLRMRDGALARTSRTLVNVKDLGRWYLGDLLPQWLGSRVEALRRRVAGGP